MEDADLETHSWFRAGLACLGEPQELCLLYIFLWLVPSLGAVLWALAVPSLAPQVGFPPLLFASPLGLAPFFPCDGVLRYHAVTQHDEIISPPSPPPGFLFVFFN